MAVTIRAVDRPDVPPCEMPERFRHEITYFMAVPGEREVPKLPPGEYWIRAAEAREWLDDGTFQIVSPLDGENKTEIEISEEQEIWLEWLVQHGIEHVRLE